MPSRKILVLSPIPAEVVRLYVSSKVDPAELKDVTIVSLGAVSKSELMGSVSDADIIVGDYTANTRLDDDVIRAAKKCLFIQQPSVGFESVDITAAAREGIAVSNAAGSNTLAVAEHTMMLILCCLKNLTLAHDMTRSARWAQDELPLHGVFELWGKNLGIVGAGRIGVEVARRAKAFGPTMIYYDINRLDADVEGLLGLSYSLLDDLIRVSDVITIHLPLNDDTANLIDARRIGNMKKNAILVNVSRGPIVDEHALATALKERRIQAAGLDVYCEEPLDPGNPLLKVPYVVLTPHVAGATNESRARIMDLAVANVIKVLRGETPENIVNGVKPRFKR